MVVGIWLKTHFMYKRCGDVRERGRAGVAWEATLRMRHACLQQTQPLSLTR